MTLSSGRASVKPVAFAEISASILRLVVLRKVNSARYLSPSLTSGGTPAKIIKSCVVRIDVEPVPKRSAPPVATATMRKAVTESLRGISTVASPLASSTTFPFHSNSVSNSSLVPCCEPPPPPGGSAFKPK